MRRRSNKRKEQEPSLVPLADMLTNTVGIMLFILAFTLLGTGGATLPKRLPMETETDAKALFFLCLREHLLPLDFKATERLPQAPEGRMDLDDARAFIRRGDGATVEDNYFTVHQTVSLIYENGRPSQIRASGEFRPKPNVGFPKLELLQGNKPFGELLRTNNPTERFLYFFLPPEGMDTFYKARELAAKMGFRSGWGPLGPKDHVVVGIIGGGGNVPKPDN